MVDDPMPTLRDALKQCLDALTGTVITSGDRAGWLTWHLDAEGEPQRMVGGSSSLYDGDAGVAWALGTLAAPTGRQDLADLAAGAARNLRPTGSGGLLGGQAGLALGTMRAKVTPVTLPDPATVAGADLTNGTAGLLLAQVRTGACGPATVAAVELLRHSARQTPVGVCWPESDEPEGRALCGMAHGNSGIALALAEAAAAHPPCADQATALAVEALRWESAWFDPIAGGWPDLRTDPPTHPALWCHGAAGMAAVRLRLLQLPAALGLPTDLLRAEAEAAVVACGADLARVLGGGGPLHGGLTLCHGLGGPLDALLLAHETWGVEEHLDAARHFAAVAIAVLGDDPLAWPAGVRADGSVALFVGVAGAAVMLARLVHPESVPSPALLL